MYVVRPRGRERILQGMPPLRQNEAITLQASGLPQAASPASEPMARHLGRLRHPVAALHTPGPHVSARCRRGRPAHENETLYRNRNPRGRGADGRLLLTSNKDNPPLSKARGVCGVDLAAQPVHRSEPRRLWRDAVQLTVERTEETDILSADARVQAVGPR